MSLMSRVTIKTRLTLLQGLAIAALVAGTAAAWSAVQSVKINGAQYSAIISSKDLIADILPPPAYLVESYLNVLELTRATEPGDIKPLEEKAVVLRKEYETRHTYWVGVLAKGKLASTFLEDSYGPAVDFYNLRDGEFLSAVRAGNQDRAVALAEGRLKELFVAHQAAIIQTVALATEDAAGIEQASAALVRRQTRLMLAVPILATLLLVAVGLGIIRSILGPIGSTVSVLELVAGGDLRPRTDARSKDEIGRMGGALNHALDGFSDAIGSISRNAVTLAGASEELSSVSQQLGANAEETAAQSNVVSAAAEQVSRSVQTVATGTEEMSASIREIAKSMADASRVAASAVVMAESTDRTIAQLGLSSQEIGKVVKVITSIAEQTNLLALNATIEAARAGEAGKGFAVVANEVKELAKETARATEDIGQKIAAIQSDADGAVAAIREISGIIGQINDIQSTIASAVEEQSATTSEIGRNIAEAAKGSNEIAGNIAAVAEAAQSTASGATQSQSSAGELGRMAADLQRLVTQFQVAAA